MSLSTNKVENKVGSTECVSCLDEVVEVHRHFICENVLKGYIQEHIAVIFMKG